MKLLVFALTLLLVQQISAKHGHERYNKNHGNNVKSHHGVVATHHGLQHRRSPIKEVCWASCDSTVVGYIEGDSLLFYYRKDLIAVLNQTSYVALILDIKNSKGALLDGTTGGGIVFSITEEEGFVVEVGLWDARTESFNEYFVCLENLNKLWKYAHDHGTSFSVKNISHQILVRIHSLLVVLSGKVAVTTRVNIHLVFKILIQASNKLVVNWGGALRWILESSGTIEGYVFKGGLEVFVTFSEGLRQFFAHVKGGVKVLIDANIKLDLKRILSLNTGIEVLAVLIETISDRVDLAVVLGDNLSNKAKIIRLAVLLGGGVQVGVDGAISVFGKVTALVEKLQPGLHKLTESLLRFSWTSVVNFEVIAKVIGIELDVSNKQIAKYNNSEQISNFTELVIGFKNKKLIVAGINLYLVVDRLVAVGQINGLRLSVQVLKVIRGAVSINRSISTLLLEILSFLETTVDAEILVKLIPVLKLEYNSKGEVDIIATIRKQIKIQSLLLVLGDIYKLLLRIPIIGDIIRFLDNILVKEQLPSLSIILKSSQSQSAIIGISNWLKVALNINVNLKGITGIIGGGGGGGAVTSGPSSSSSSTSSSSSSSSGTITGGGGGGIGIGIGIGGGIGLPFGVRSPKKSSHKVDVHLKKKHHKDVKIKTKKHQPRTNQNVHKQHRKHA